MTGAVVLSISAEITGRDSCVENNAMLNTAMDAPRKPPAMISLTKMVVCAEQPDGNHQHWNEVKSVIARVVRPEHDNHRAYAGHMPRQKSFETWATMQGIETEG